VTRVPRRAAAALLATTLLYGAAGCGGGDDPQAGDDPTSGPSPSSATTAGDPTSGSTDASTGPATPSVTPATGIALTEASSTVNAPAGWTKQPDLVSFASAAGDPGASSTMELVDSGDISGGGSLDQQATSAIQVLPKGSKAKRLADVSLDGVMAFHIHYTEPGSPMVYDTITTVRNGRNVGLDFVLSKKVAATQPDLVASVLATFRWIA
jgi:hypothetical protein